MQVGQLLRRWTPASGRRFPGSPRVRSATEKETAVVIFVANSSPFSEVNVAASRTKETTAVSFFVASHCDRPGARHASGRRVAASPRRRTAPRLAAPASSIVYPFLVSALLLFALLL